MESSVRIREHASEWGVCVTDALRREQLIDLIVGRLGAIHVKEFFPKPVANASALAARELEMSRYSPELIFPPVEKSGVALFDYYDDGQISKDYWSASAAATKERVLCFEEAGDPLSRSIGALREAWNASVQVATSNGRELFAGMRRQFSHGAKYHFDDINIEFPGVIDDDIIQQLGFNLFLEVPRKGGAVTIAQHLYSPRDEAVRDGYGYSPLVVEHDNLVSIAPEVGDAILFCTHNMHSVEPVTEGKRVTFSFFIGITVLNKLVLWS